MDRGETFCSAEVYDPITNTWSSIGNMRSTFTLAMLLAVVKEQLYGITNNRNYPRHDPQHKIIEVYDEETDTWNISASINIPRDGVGFGVVRMLV